MLKTKPANNSQYIAVFSCLLSQLSNFMIQLFPRHDLVLPAWWWIVSGCPMDQFAWQPRLTVIGTELSLQSKRLSTEVFCQLRKQFDASEVPCFFLFFFCSFTVLFQRKHYMNSNTLGFLHAWWRHCLQIIIQITDWFTVLLRHPVSSFNFFKSLFDKQVKFKFIFKFLLQYFDRLIGWRHFV